MHPTPVTLTFDLLTLKAVFESRVTWATSAPILVLLGLSVLDLGPMYATDRRQTDVRQHYCLMPPPRGQGYNNELPKQIVTTGKFVRKFLLSFLNQFAAQ